MKQKIILSLVLGLFLVTMVSAAVASEADNLIFPFNVAYDVKVPCINNGTYCSAVAECNLTITYPNGELLTNNALMTNQLAFHNLTVTQAQNNELGKSSGSVSCCDGPDCAQTTFTIDITGDGFKFNVFPMEFSVLILGVILIITGVFSDRLRIFKHVGSLIVMVIGVATLYPGWANFNYSNIQGLALGTGSIGLGFYFLIEDSFSRDKQEETYQSQNREFPDDGRFHG